MLTNALINILNMSLTASVVIIFILFARLLLKKAPKIFSHALWGAAAFRLLCPFSISAVFSLFSRLGAKTTENGRIEYIPPPPQNLAPAPNNSFNSSPLPAADSTSALTAGQDPSVFQYILQIGAAIWLLGICAMLIYSAFSYLRLKKQLKDAVYFQENIFFANNIPTAFVVGVFCPKIYVPATIEANTRSYIIMHEQTHIKRLDHITKFIGFIALCIHWFNPLVWLAFILFSRDMEMSCDESVMKKLKYDARCEYSTALLKASAERRFIAAVPPAFGEGNAKKRIKNIMNYKKPSFWVILLAAICVAALCIFMLLNPKNKNEAGGFLPDNILSNTLAVPDFLNEEQEQLYKQANAVFAIFSGVPENINLFLHEGEDLSNKANENAEPYRRPLDDNSTDEHTEYYAYWYYPVTGRYKNWADFESMGLSLFTKDYFEELCGDIFINVDGKCYYADVAMGGAFGYAPEEMPDTFELINQSHSSVDFILTGHYYIDGYVEDNQRSDYHIQNFPVSMLLTSDGWRISNFSLAALSSPLTEYNSGSYLNKQPDALNIMTADEYDYAPYSFSYSVTSATDDNEISYELFDPQGKSNLTKIEKGSTEYIEFVFTQQTPLNVQLGISDLSANQPILEYPFDNSLENRPHRIKLPQDAGTYLFFASIEWFNGQTDTIRFFVEIY